METEKALWNHFAEADMQELEASGRNPLLLQDADSLWIVKSGHVDVFVVPLTNGEISGKRHHLFRAEQGDWLFGLGFSPSDSALGVIAAGTPGTRLVRLSAARALQKATDEELTAAQVRGIETWISRLSRAVGKRGAPGGGYQLIDDGMRHAQFEADTVLRPASSLLWAVHEEGRSRWQGGGPFALELAARPFPLAPESWLIASEAITLTAVSTRSWLEGGNGQEDLLHFHAGLMSALHALLQDSEQTERERLEQRKEQDRMLAQKAYQSLASVLESDKRRSFPDSDTRDPLHLACQIIGEAQGIAFAAPPPQQPAQYRDPVAAIARASRIRYRQVLLKGEWWKEDGGPLLAFMKEDARPVALIPASPGRYMLYDPVAGTRTAVGAEAASRLQPEAYCFYRSFPAKKLNWLDLVKFGIASGVKRDLLMVAIVGLAGGLLNLATPLATGILFDAIIPESLRSQLFHMTAILTVSALAVFLFELTRAVAVLRLEGRMDHAIQSAVWDRLLGLPVPFFRQFTAGDLAMRANSINAIRQMLSGITMTAILSGVFSSFNLLLLFYYDTHLALLALAVLVVAVAASAGIGLFKIRFQRKLMALEGEISGLVLQMINGIAKFKSAGAEQRAFHLWAQKFVRHRTVRFAAGLLDIVHAIVIGIFPVIASIVFFYSVVLGGGSALSPGLFLAFHAAFAGLMTAMLSMTHGLLQAVDVIPLYERAKPILETLPEYDESKADPGQLSGAIEVSHVSFRYQDDQPLVLQDVSLSARPGEFIAIVGASGSGKSTLLKLLLGFETPESGSIYYDGHDLKELDIRAVRSQLGVVIQNGQLMSGDIFQNIIGSANLTLEDAWEAARMAGLEADIKAMPMGMHTVISEGAATISGGQKQRILIARAIVRRPRILYFDEATSALDNRTQQLVSESLEKLKSTRIVIAHRLSTIMNADRIYVMEKGRVVQAGTYRELMETEGPFRAMALRQLA